MLFLGVKHLKGEQTNSILHTVHVDIPCQMAKG